MKTRREYLLTTGNNGPPSFLRGRYLPSTFQVCFRRSASKEIHTLTAWNISGPGNDQLDLNKLISTGVRSLVHLTENIKHVQGLFHLVDIQRGF